MKTGFRFALSIAALSLVVACGPPDDPSKENNSENNSTNNSTMGNNTTTNGNANGQTNTQTNNVDPNNNTNNTNTNGATNNNMPDMVDLTFFGQIGSEFDEHGGGAPTTEALTNDAGLQAVVEANTAMEEETLTVDVDVSGAIVTATGFGDRRFWVEDANAAVQVFVGEDLPMSVTVGDAVSFKVTEVGNFLGHPQVQVIEGLTIDSSGNEVPYMDKTGEAVSAEDYNRIVRIGGKLSDTGDSCGGDSICYDMTHDGQTIIFRSASNFIEGGEFITFVGPLQSFPGPQNDDGTSPDWQLDHINFSWTPFMD